MKLQLNTARPSTKRKTITVLLVGALAWPFLSPVFALSKIEDMYGPYGVYHSDKMPAHLKIRSYPGVSFYSYSGIDVSCGFAEQAEGFVLLGFLDHRTKEVQDPPASRQFCL